MVQVLTVCGSLRQASINRRLLAAVTLTAPTDITIQTADMLGVLPLFNPDLEGNEPPSVLAWRLALANSDCMVIASPEYAHGITGVLKNALDWVVGSGETVGKPAAVLNAAPRSNVANLALKEVLQTMDTRLVPAACLDIPVLGTGLSAEALLADPELGPLIRSVLPALRTAL